MTSSEINTLKKCAETLLEVAKKLEVSHRMVLIGDLEVLEDLVVAEFSLSNGLSVRLRTREYVTARQIFVLAARRRFDAPIPMISRYLGYSEYQVRGLLRSAPDRMAEGEFFTRYNNITYKLEHHGRLTKSPVQKKDSQPIPDQQCAV